MKLLLENLTANGTGPKVPIQDGRTFVVGIAADADLGAGTLTLKVLDNATSTELATVAERYDFTAVFEPFEITLAPGMALQAELAGASAPSISGMFLYQSED
jgi:hypothetical protein